jgi:hypothetical protein
MIPTPTPEQLAGIELHEKERKERCDKILKRYEKKPKGKSEEQIKQEQIKKFRNS